MGKLHFYHSFPRYKSVKLAFATLRSILDYGLLLTSEKRMLPKSGLLKRAPLVQDRLCFTAIEPEYLSEHAKAFGMFSIEFSADVIRSFGAQPVMYLSGDLAGGRLLTKAGTDLVRHVLQSRDVLKRFWKLSEKKTALGKKAKTIRKRVYPYKEPFERCFFSVQALLNLYYPTDRKNKTKPLKFFRQREWRIIPNFAFKNKWLYPYLTRAQKKRLMGINPQFFRVKVGRRRRISRCMRFPLVGHASVLEGARRLIVPDRYLSRVQNLVDEYPTHLRVVPLSAL